jgi:hypothetical protein
MELSMRIHALASVAIAVLLAFAGCASVSQQETAARRERAVHRAIDAQRACDANAASEHRSFWTSLGCWGGGALPPDCEKAGTDDLPVCHAWGLERVAATQSAWQRATMIGILGYDPSP